MHERLNLFRSCICSVWELQPAQSRLPPLRLWLRVATHICIACSAHAQRSLLLPRSWQQRMHDSMMLRGTATSRQWTRFSVPELHSSSSKTSTDVHRCTCQHGQATCVNRRPRPSLSARVDPALPLLQCSASLGSCRLQLEVVKSLLAHKANVKAAAMDDMLPLHFAAQKGHAEICRHLITSGAPKEPLLTRRPRHRASFDS